MTLRLPWLAGLLAALVLAPVVSFAAIPVYGVQVVRTYPHDRAAFTEGLFYLDGWLYESTGQNVRPAIRRVDLATGKV
ncbi:MAG TPA: glutaminyl-peptide cyclotransferase, partial [Caulobacteraceae bacterium]|nr:glutaminyl-peptide cyclotransferase [Caulobacteraceae bacterium]